MLNRFTGDYLESLGTADFAPAPKISGRLASFDGLLMEAIGLNVPVGTVCQVGATGGAKVEAEVIGFRNGRTLLRRQMVERRVDTGSLDAVARGSGVLAKQSALRVVAHQRDVRESVELGQRVGERHEGCIDMWSDGKRVGERGERARRHPNASGKIARRARGGRIM